MASKTASATSAPAKKFVEKPEKPDEEKFKQEREKCDKELQEVKGKLKALLETLSQFETPRTYNGEKPAQTAVQKKQSELRAELASIRNAQSGFNSSKQKVHDQIETLDTALKGKISEQKAAKNKIPFRTLPDIDAAIANLEKEIEGGKMKIVDERRAMDNIAAYRRHRKNLQGLESTEEAIKADKAKISELKAQLVEDPEQKKVNDRSTEINTELELIKAEQDEAYRNISSLREERNKLRDQEKEKWDALKGLEREYYKARDAYRDYERRAYEVRREKFKAEREARDKEYKLQIATQKMEEASQPAFQSEINTCENLIAHFDPTSAEAQAAKTKGSLLKDAGLKALATRAADTNTLSKGIVLTKKEDKEDDYFIGKPKKGKKGSNKGSGAATPTTTAAEEKDKGKFQLNHVILTELGKVDVRAPAKWDDVPDCVEKLREKLAWYKENSDRVTKENIAKAQKEIDRLDGKDADSKDDGSKTPVSEDDEKEDATPEQEEEEEKPLPVPSTTDEAKAE